MIKIINKAAHISKRKKCRNLIPNQSHIRLKKCILLNAENLILAGGGLALTHKHIRERRFF